jgi:hypothetical protein
MSELLRQSFQAMMSLSVAIISYYLTPVISAYIPIAESREIVSGIIFLALYALFFLVVSLFISVPAFRYAFDERTKYLGIYVSHSISTTDPIVGLFEIKFRSISKEYFLRGVSIDPRDQAGPVGGWSGILRDFDLVQNRIAYIYSGFGKDARDNTADQKRSLGLAVLDFKDPDGNFGEGQFRDHVQGARFVSIHFERLTPELINKVTGKRKTRLRKFEDKYKFSVRYIDDKIKMLCQAT